MICAKPSQREYNKCSIFFDKCHKDYEHLMLHTAPIFKSNK